MEQNKVDFWWKAITKALQFPILDNTRIKRVFLELYEKTHMQVLENYLVEPWISGLNFVSAKKTFAKIFLLYVHN